MGHGVDHYNGNLSNTLAFQMIIVKVVCGSHETTNGGTPSEKHAFTDSKHHTNYHGCRYESNQGFIMKIPCCTGIASLKL